jgi:hypothetical protein
VNVSVVYLSKSVLPVHVSAVPICCHCCESSPIWHHGTLQSIHYISNLPIWEVYLWLSECMPAARQTATMIYARTDNHVRHRHIKPVAFTPSIYICAYVLCRKATRLDTW